MHLRKTSSLQRIGYFLACQGLTFKQSAGQELDQAPVMINKIPRSCLQVSKRAIAFPFFPVYSKQQVCHNIAISGGMVAFDAFRLETPLCFLSGKRANNSVMVTPNASPC